MNNHNIMKMLLQNKKDTQRTMPWKKYQSLTKQQLNVGKQLGWWGSQNGSSFQWMSIKKKKEKWTVNLW